MHERGRECTSCSLTYEKMACKSCRPYILLSICPYSHLTGSLALKDVDASASALSTLAKVLQCAADLVCSLFAFGILSYTCSVWSGWPDQSPFVNLLLKTLSIVVSFVIYVTLSSSLYGYSQGRYLELTFVLLEIEEMGTRVKPLAKSADEGVRCKVETALHLQKQCVRSPR